MRFTVLAVVLGLTGALAPTSGASISASGGSPGVMAQAAPTRVTVVAAPGTAIRIEGHYPTRGTTCEAKKPKPLRARYRGTLEIVREGNGRLRILNTLSMDDYLAGLAEVPAHWPAAALQAQAIAARTYAMRALRNAGGSYDICASDACQVYRGAAIETGAFGERWKAAVDDTRGRALLYRGAPINAFYHSTSTGRTRPAFPGGTPQAYLTSVPGEDGDAPLARWTATFTRAQLATILRRSGAWPGGQITRVRQSGANVVLERAGRDVTLSKRRLRNELNAEAACTYPRVFPQAGSQAGTKMPLTVPSSTYSVVARGNTIQLRGRGWGHDVGMSQWGARSLAERGRSAKQILKYYYPGATLGSVREPASVRVLAASGMVSIRVAPEGEATVRGATVPEGPFVVTGGDAMSVSRATGPGLPPTLKLSVGRATITADPGREAEIPLTLSTSARVSGAVARDGRTVRRVAEVSLRNGEGTLSIPTIDDAGRPLASGVYTVSISAFDGLDRVSTTVEMQITDRSSPTPDGAAPPVATVDGEGGRGLAIAVALLALIGATWFASRNARRRRDVPQPNVNE